MPKKVAKGQLKQQTAKQAGKQGRRAENKPEGCS